MALTDTVIRKVKTKEAAYRLTDGRGLYLSITPAGGKLWRWKYRFEGREKLMSLGRYPDVSLSQARERHSAARKLLATGIDPMAQRKAERTTTENTFQKVATSCHEHWQHGKTLRHADYVRRRMEADVFPILGARPIEEIEAPELVALIHAIQARGAHEMAKRHWKTSGRSFDTP